MTLRFAALLVASLAAADAARSDEAVRRDGTHVRGTLKLADGRFAFRSGDRDEPVADLEFIRFSPKPPAQPAVALWHHVRLGRGEELLAELRSLDATHLHVRPAWTEVLAIPRTAVERVTHAPGWQPLIFDAFSAGMSTWILTGKPRVEDGHLVLNAGQAVETRIKSPAKEGRVSIGFRSAVTRSRTLAVEFGFERDGKPAAVSVELVGPGERYAVASPTKPDHDGRLQRDADPHRLTAEFDGSRLDLFLDHLVLWSQPGPGELRSVRLTAGGDGTETASVNDVLVSRAQRAAEPRSWADLTADAVRSPDGDETFGSLVAAGPGGVALEIKARTLNRTWPDVSEFTFRRGPILERPTAGEHVRVRVRTTDGLHDVLDGAVKAFDDKVLVLAHAVLGDLTIPRDRLEEVRLHLHGRRVPVDTAPHHLGTRPAFGFAVPKPQGLRLALSAKVDPRPADGFVVVDAAQLNGAGTPVEVLVNGERIGDLNRFADRPQPIVRAYRLPVSATAWRRGENEIELRLRPGDSGRVTGVDIRAVRLELHDPR